MKPIHRANLLDWKVFCLLAASVFLVTGLDSTHQKNIAKEQADSHQEFASLIDPQDLVDDTTNEETSKDLPPDPSL